MAENQSIVLKVHGTDQAEELNLDSGVTCRDLIAGSDILNNGTPYNFTTVGKDGMKVNIDQDQPLENYVHKPNQEVFALVDDPVAV